MSVEARAVQNVAVIGAGTMGHAIALEFALGGYSVVLVDRTEAILEKALSNAEDCLRTLVEAGFVAAADSPAVLRRLRPCLSLQTAVSEADYVVEAVYEDLTLKQSLFGHLGRLALPHAVLASNTSGLSGSALAIASGHPERTLITHYFNPPHLIPLVEVVPNSQTSAETLNTVSQVLSGLGKRLVVLKREVPGFIANRLQYAMLREALSLVEREVANVEDVDTVVRYSLGRRLGVLGPLATADFGGLDVFHSILSYLGPDVCNATDPSPLLTQKVRAGNLGVKTGRGLYEWSPERAQALRHERDRVLLRWLVEDREARG